MSKMVLNIIKLELIFILSFLIWGMIVIYICVALRLKAVFIQMLFAITVRLGFLYFLYPILGLRYNYFQILSDCFLFACVTIFFTNLLLRLYNVETSFKFINELKLDWWLAVYGIIFIFILFFYMYFWYLCDFIFGTEIISSFQFRLLTGTQSWQYEGYFFDVREYQLIINLKPTRFKILNAVWLFAVFVSIYGFIFAGVAFICKLLNEKFLYFLFSEWAVWMLAVPVFIYRVLVFFV